MFHFKKDLVVRKWSKRRLQEVVQLHRELQQRLSSPAWPSTQNLIGKISMYEKMLVNQITIIADLEKR